MYTVRDYVKAVMIYPGDESFCCGLIDFVTEKVRTVRIGIDELKAISLKADKQISSGAARWRWQVFSDELRPRFPDWPKRFFPEKEQPPTREERAKILKELETESVRRADEPGSQVPGNASTVLQGDFGRLDEQTRRKLKQVMIDSVGEFEEAAKMLKRNTKKARGFIEDGRLDNGYKGLDWFKTTFENMAKKAESALSEIKAATSVDEKRIEEETGEDR